MKALVLAAGKSERFYKDFNQNKLSYKIFGEPLLKRVITSVGECGIGDITVVTGYESQNIEKILGNGESLNINIQYIYNPDWEKGNGTSVLIAGQRIQEKFVLLMGDHLFDKNNLLKLLDSELEKEGAVLAIDENLNQIIDLEEATKVNSLNNKILEIGKKISNYNAVDTGMFLCTPEVFKVLNKACSENKFFLTDAMCLLASRKKLNSIKVEKNSWIDIDTKEDLVFAQAKLKNLF